MRLRTGLAKAAPLALAMLAIGCGSAGSQPPADESIPTSPDRTRGDIVKAFIVLASGHSPSDELAAQIKQHVRERHSAYAYPREIEFVDDLPKTLTGKIRRVELREAERRRKAAETPA